MMQYATEETIERCRTWLAETKEKLKSNMTNNVGSEQVSLPSVKPLLVNRKQMYAVFMTIKSIFDKVRNTSESNDLHRLILQGSAGTGKSQVLKIVTRLTLRLSNNLKSVLNLAPTGAAAILLPNGRTIHSAVHIPRDSGPTVAITDAAVLLKAPQMRELKHLLGNGDDQLELLYLMLMSGEG